MFAVFEQVFILFAFALAGFTLAKLKLVNAEHSKILSTLLVYFFLPCNVIKTFAGSFTIPYISTRLDIIITACVLLVAVILVAELSVHLLEKDKYRRAVYRYSLVIPNLGYMGWPLVGALYGEEMMLSSMVFCLPMQFYIYTYGYAALTKGGMRLKSLLNPTMISLLIGIVLGLTGFELPSLLTKTMETASACLGPISMVLAGIVISEYNPLEIIRDRNVWIVTAMRMLLIPIAIALVAKQFVGGETLILAVLMNALPCGLNTIVFPKLVNEDCRPGAALGLISNVLACATIPFIVAFFLP